VRNDTLKVDQTWIRQRFRPAKYAGRPIVMGIESASLLVRAGEAGRPERIPFRLAKLESLPRVFELYVHCKDAAAGIAEKEDGVTF
jgi:hypothetical protein